MSDNDDQKADSSPAQALQPALLAEFLGTGLLTTGGLSAAALAHAGRLPTLVAVSAAPGLVILALVYIFSDLSGAHFNPGVTLAFALRGSFARARVPGYLVAQITGCLVAGFVVRAAHLLPVPHERASLSGSFWLEVLCTALLTLVILAAAKRKAEVGTQAGIVVAGTLAVCGLLAGPLSVISLNPALALAYAVASGSLNLAWPHLSGPLLGAVVATGLTFALRGEMNADEADAANGEGGG